MSNRMHAHEIYGIEQKLRRGKQIILFTTGNIEGLIGLSLFFCDLFLLKTSF